MIGVEITVNRIAIVVFTVNPDPSIKGSYSTFQYAHSPSYAVATIVRDKTHEQNSKSSLICQIIEELRRKNLSVDSALRK